MLHHSQDARWTLRESMAKSISSAFYRPGVCVSILCLPWTPAVQLVLAGKCSAAAVVREF